MKALRVLRALSSQKPNIYSTSSSFSLFRFYSAQSQSENDSIEDYELPPSFDSSDYSLPTGVVDAPSTQEPIWDKSHRSKADKVIFGKDTIQQKSILKTDESSRRAKILARALLEAGMEKSDVEEEEDMIVKEEDQKSLSVGIIGAPNAGKSALTNFMVGSKVAAVSRKTNTTTHEVLGVMTKGNTQMVSPLSSFVSSCNFQTPDINQMFIFAIQLRLKLKLVYMRTIARKTMKIASVEMKCFFDTPGLMLRSSGHPCKTDVGVRVESAWSSVNLYDVLMVVFDVYRHLSKPDKRVIRLINHVGAQVHPKQKRVLCMNKVDLVENKKDLLKVAKEFGDLPGYERYFMISGLKGSGAVKRPWEEDPTAMTEDIMKNISLEVVREKLLDHIHQEIPYTLEHRLIDWKDLKDGSLRIEQHLIVSKPSQRRILIGKKGSKIGRIGMEANEELRSIFKKDVHLIIQVRVA
ncbi:hypothetical protein C5167_031944 [Papaver somniferum]|uniref:KH type-2 domain-containing protein n=1 Tax=Papaver somniferum TaxID=3469 RepID=A0A4Y7K968_PAPSO|nr:hypothetical protein C5167_031944 [Papaver somniferum]